jgi:alkaline phosphatase D
VTKLFQTHLERLSTALYALRVSTSPMTRDPLLESLFVRYGTRRDFLAFGARASALIALGARPGTRHDPSWRAPAYPFSLGIASGDPLADGVVLWTRLAPDLARSGGMPATSVPVRWEVASDDAFRRIVKRGEETASPDLAHSVHAEVSGLDPAREYFYRFIAGGETSPIGRTVTAPAAGAQNAITRFAFVSCQHYEMGYFSAYRHLSQEPVDLVLHLGDYIYEYGIGDRVVRRHDGDEITTLEQYRARYALYKSDRDLQAAHATAPFVVTNDDHEVENNFANDRPEDGSEAATFLRRRAAAYQAYYEHMPLRRSSMPQGPGIQLYRRLSYGSLLQFHVLDTRQYRTDQPCGDGRRPRCPEVFAETATITGAEQERWLLESLDGSRARWNVLANQVLFSELAGVVDGQKVHPMDTWNAYMASRGRVLEFLARRKPSNPVVLTGDIHLSMALDIKANFEDPTSATLGAELVGTSISSGGDGAAMTPNGQTLMQNNAHIRFFNQQRGYVRCTVTPERWTADYRIVPFVTRMGAPIETAASFVLENGRPGLTSA